MTTVEILEAAREHWLDARRRGWVQWASSSIVSVTWPTFEAGGDRAWDLLVLVSGDPWTEPDWDAAISAAMREQ